MTPTEFRAHLRTLGWTPWALAERLGVNPTTTRRWASGDVAIPKNVAAWVERLAEGIEADALPEGWVRREHKGEPVDRSTFSPFTRGERAHDRGEAISIIPPDLDDREYEEYRRGWEEAAGWS